MFLHARLMTVHHFPISATFHPRRCSIVSCRFPLLTILPKFVKCLEQKVKEYILHPVV